MHVLYVPLKCEDIVLNVPCQSVRKLPIINTFSSRCPLILKSDTWLPNRLMRNNIS